MIRKTHKYLTRQYMLSRDYEVFYYRNTDLTGVSLHHHDFYECYLFISGDVTYLIEGKAYSLNPGDMEFQQNIKALLNKLLSLENYNGIGKELLYKAYITEIMVHLNNLAFNENAYLDTDIKKSSLIDRVIDYINSHIDEDITIDDLSEYLYISKFHLSREFKKYTGTTIHRYIVQKKLIEAKGLILENIPVIHVYKKCGFGDYSNFLRAFKNEYGVTPRQFYEAMSK